MPIDPNEAPEGTIAVEHAGEECPGKICVFFRKHNCNQVKCHAAERKDKTNRYFIKKPQPTETKPMEDEYEYIVADSAENCKTIVDWVFDGSAQIRRRTDNEFEMVAIGAVIRGMEYRRKKPQPDVLLTDPKEIARGILVGVVECMPGTIWLHATDHDTNFIATKLELGAKYRLKPGYKLPPKKTKKLVPRTLEEFWPLIGKWWLRNKDGEPRILITSDDWSHCTQENWEIAPLGSEEWEPMMVLKEVEGEE